MSLALLCWTVWRCSVVAWLMTDDKPPDYGADKNLVRHEIWPLTYLYFCHSQSWHSGTLDWDTVQLSSATEVSPE